MLQLTIILNRKHHRKANAALSRLAEKCAHKKLLIRETSHPGHAIQLTREALQEGAHGILAVGGDGTLNEVVNGYMQWKTDIADAGAENPDNEIRHVEAEPLPFIGIIPVGSGNDFARFLNISQNIDEKMKAISDSDTQLIDVGMVTYTDKSGKPALRYFINITDVGIGAYVVKNVNESPKLLGGQMTYMKEIMRGLLRYRHERITATGEGVEYSGKILGLIVANGKYFGHGLGIAPHAQLNNGQFAVTILGEVSILDYLKNFSNLKKARPIEDKRVVYGYSATLSVQGDNKSLPIDMDGEFIGYTPARFTVLPQQIPFLRG